MELELGQGADGEDDEEDEDFTMQAFCDETNNLISFGGWWHKMGEEYDICPDEYDKLVRCRLLH